ncbi:MAG: hypothetical protein QOG73_573 [Acetobacteraceae bacterium]|jgi:hypothetical protein|nr:hypothetical protein [Acetobacteraceae bacterium]
MPSVLPHNQRAGSTWGSGGEAYEAISENVADGIAHVVSRAIHEKYRTPAGLAMPREHLITIGVRK